jgi:hypothetical protein
MNDIHHPILSSKMPTIRQRLPFSGVPSVHMIKLKRGLIQRSLLYCFEKGYFSRIRHLLQTGIDARECDNEGRNGLMYCCFINNDSWAQNIAMTLIEYGAKIDDQDQRGLNALHYAIITQRLILIRRYLASLDFHLNQTVDIYGNTCLHYACSTGNPDVVRLILNAMKRYSIDLTIQNHAGLSAYDVARHLNHERCQNLLRNEIILHERNHIATASSTTTNLSHISIKTLTERRISTSTRIRPITSTTHLTGSIASVPLCNSTSKNFRKRCPSILSFDNENIVHAPVIIIDPIESRNMSLKHNESLDLTLATQVKSRSDFAPLPLISPSIVDSLSSSTWRDDFAKMFNQLQTFKTPSCRKTAHPPLSNELSCELFENLYGMRGVGGHDCSNHQPLSSLPTPTSQKITHRRSSTTSIKSLLKTKK